MVVRISPRQTVCALEPGPLVSVIVLKGVTAAFVVTVSEQAPEVTVIEYNPAIAGVADVETSGFCNADVKPPGPVQEYESIPFGLPVRLKDVPSQTGPLFPAAAPSEAAAVKVIGVTPVASHVLSAVLRTVKVYVFGASPAKVGLAW
jgi:hypothetical protein